MAVAPEKISEEQEEVLSSLEKKFPELLPREDIIIVLQEARFRTDGIAFILFSLSLSHPLRQTTCRINER